jgi:hypothetical protein
MFENTAAAHRWAIDKGAAVTKLHQQKAEVKFIMLGMEGAG